MVRRGVVAVSGAASGGGASLVDGKNNSRDASDGETEQSALDDHLDLTSDDDDGRYDCRHVYMNMEMEADDGETARYRCKSWDCYSCAHWMRMNLIEEIERLSEERPELRRFLTLTLDPSQAPDDPDEQHRYLTERFNALRTEIRDRYDDLSYIWVREEGESGNPHLHFLVDRYLPQSEISMLADRVGLGEVVDIRQVSARNVAKYITKYMTKGALADLPKGIQRYGSSQDIDLAVRGSNEEPKREWKLMMDDYVITTEDGEPLRRRATRQDIGLQKQWQSPVPPD